MHHDDLTGVPDSITREQYTGLLTALGLGDSMRHLRSVSLGVDFIRAEVMATTKDGRLVVDPIANEVACHHIVIPFRDEPADG